MAENTDKSNAVKLFESASRDDCMKALEEIFSRRPVETGGAIRIHLVSFTNINETFGFRHGDILLGQVAEFLNEIEGASVFRLGGGVSFVILLPGADSARAVSVSQQLLERFEQSWHIGQVDCVCSADIGVLVYPEYAETPDELMQNLGFAVNESAKAGHNQATIFSASLQERIYRGAIIARLLGTAVVNNNIDLRYRPTYCGRLKQYSWVECQPQLLTVEFGPINTAEFIPIAEESGIVYFVGMHILRGTCAFIRNLLDEGLDFETVLVEISPVMLIQQGFLRDLSELMAQYGIPPGKLALEFHSIPLTAGTTRTLVDELRLMGVKTVLGNFDLSSVAFKDLLTLPLDALKLKRLFIWQLETNSRSGPIIEGLIHMCESLGVTIIAEGVETERQNSLLNRYGCPYRQGFYYSPSVTASELRGLLPKKQ